MRKQRRKMFRRNWTALFVVSLTITVGLPGLAAADFIQKDSADFNLKNWEMDTVPTPLAGDVSGWSVNAGILTITEDGAYRYFGDMDNPTSSVGWTFEMRSQVTNAGGIGGPLGVQISDDISVWTFGIMANGIEDENHSRTMIYSEDLTDAFHTIRIAYDGSEVEIWIDGVTGLIQAPVSLAQGLTRMLIGNFGAVPWNSGQIEIDYVRMDTTGGYAPVPEPASLGLLATLGGFFMVKAKRR